MNYGNMKKLVAKVQANIVCSAGAAPACRSNDETPGCGTFINKVSPLGGGTFSTLLFNANHV